MIFSAGVPPVLAYIGMDDPSAYLNGPLSVQRIIVAFSISLFLNMFFSPVLMTAHRVTDAHIQNGKGTISGFFSLALRAEYFIGNRLEDALGFYPEKNNTIILDPGSHTNLPSSS